MRYKMKINEFLKKYRVVKKIIPGITSSHTPHVVCKDGFKMSYGQPVLDKLGEPIKAFICPYRKPMDYYALKDKDDKILKSAFIEKKDSLEAKTEEGEKIVKMNYHIKKKALYGFKKTLN